jgi:hypothetical protein
VWNRGPHRHTNSSLHTITVQFLVFWPHQSINSHYQPEVFCLEKNIDKPLLSSKIAVNASAKLK